MMTTFRRLYPVALISYADRFVLVPLLPVLADDLHISQAAAAAVLSAYLLPYGLGQLASGTLTDRFGRIRVIRIALAGVALADLASALAPSLDALLVTRIVAGTFAAALYPVSVVYLGDQVSIAERPRAMARLLAAGAMGTTVAVAGSELSAPVTGWRAPFLAIAVLAVCAATLARRLPDSTTTTTTSMRWVALRQTATRGWVPFVVAYGFIEGAVMLGAFTFLGPRAADLGLGASASAIVLGTYGLATLAGIAVADLVARTRRPALAFGFGGCVLAAGYLAAAVTSNPAGLLLASVGLGLAFALLQPALQSWATELVPAMRGTTTSLVVAAAFTGAAAGTSAGATLANSHRYGLLFGLAAGVALAVGAVGMFARMLWRRSPTVPDAAEWDRRHATSLPMPGQQLMDPNPLVAAEIAGLTPGRALDLGCGQGRHALWLASQGWAVVGVDFSAVAVRRARDHSEEKGLTVDLTVADVTRYEPASASFDLVLVAYLHLRRSQRRAVLRIAERALAPGGTLVMVGFDRRHGGAGGPQDSLLRIQPDELLADLRASAPRLRHQYLECHRADDTVSCVLRAQPALETPGK